MATTNTSTTHHVPGTALSALHILSYETDTINSHILQTKKLGLQEVKQFAKGVPHY